jgi:hypothetical protein
MARHRAGRKRRAARPRRECRAAHAYGPGQAVGAGILRFVCNACGAVSIDITGVDTPTAIGSLFESAEGTLERT